jgi:hypothetical protein
VGKFSVTVRHPNERNYRYCSHCNAAKGTQAELNMGKLVEYPVFADGIKSADIIGVDGMGILLAGRVQNFSQIWLG